jgi:hypothetical protein
MNEVSDDMQLVAEHFDFEEIFAICKALNLLSRLFYDPE